MLALVQIQIGGWFVVGGLARIARPLCDAPATHLCTATSIALAPFGHLELVPFDSAPEPCRFVCAVSGCCGSDGLDGKDIGFNGSQDAYVPFCGIDSPLCGIEPDISWQLRSFWEGSR